MFQLYISKGLKGIDGYPLLTQLFAKHRFNILLYTNFAYRALPYTSS